MSVSNFFEKIGEIPHYIKHWYQRAKYGYSYRDVWSIDWWFMEVMPRMLQDLKATKHGIPGEFVKGKSDEDFELAQKEWNAVLDRMIFCFTEMHEDKCSMTNEFAEEWHKQLSAEKHFEPVEDHSGCSRLIHGKVEPELDANFHKKQQAIEDYRERMKNEGLDLFKKYFWNLWD